MTWEEAAEKYNFVKLGQDGIPEIYTDHHTLSSLRSCEAFFHESIVNSLARKTGGRSWYLDIGIWTHASLEIFYNHIKENRPLNCADWVEKSMLLWNAMEMSSYWEPASAPYKTHGYKTLGGPAGAVKLLIDYFQTYGEGRETLKIIGIEIAFGLAKEVPLGEIMVCNPKNGIMERVRCYYSGRMDAIVDDNYSIAPMDTKTTSKFSGKEGLNFKPHEGMLGYMFALQKIMHRYFPNINRPANKVYINHISIAPATNYIERFKRSSVIATPAELEAWRLRQLSTMRRVVEIAIHERTPDWNTSICSNMFHSDCTYKTLHTHDPMHRLVIIQSDFTKKPEWNPYNLGEDITKQVEILPKQEPVK